MKVNRLYLHSGHFEIKARLECNPGGYSDDLDEVCPSGLKTPTHL